MISSGDGNEHSPEGERTHTHIPVLKQAVLEYLAAPGGGTIVDCTVGLGGHAAAIAESVGDSGTVVGLDTDADILSQAEKRLKGFGATIRLSINSYTELPEVLASYGIDTVDGVLADFGVNSVQLDDPARGFSFQHDGPLDMRMDSRLNVRAADIVNTYPVDKLADLIEQYGQEPRSRKIARQIDKRRHEHRLDSTAELAMLVCIALGVDPRRGDVKIHPATRTFQALRIAVNDELGNIEKLMHHLPDVLKPGGRAVMISFHSLEDGLVKRYFKQYAQEGVFDVLTARPVKACPEDVRANPRARSARLRAAVRK